MNEERIYLWRAWTANRERIADCGIANASSEEDARAIGWMCLGGPHMHEVVEMQVELLNAKPVVLS